MITANMVKEAYVAHNCSGHQDGRCVATEEFNEWIDRVREINGSRKIRELREENASLKKQLLDGNLIADNVKITELRSLNERLRSDLARQYDNNRELARQLDAATEVVKTAREWKEAAIMADRRAVQAENQALMYKRSSEWYKERFDALRKIPSSVLEEAYPGKREIGCIELSAEAYEYDQVAVLHDDQGFYIATDYGCSCPTPFENNREGDDLIVGPLTADQVSTELNSIARNKLEGVTDQRDRDRITSHTLAMIKIVRGVDLIGSSAE